MDPQIALDLSRSAVQTSLFVGGPILLVILALGIVVGIVQSATQLHDQAISLIPKILIVFATLAIFLPMLCRPLIDFAEQSFSQPMFLEYTDSNPAAPSPTLPPNAPERIANLSNMQGGTATMGRLPASDQDNQSPNIAPTENLQPRLESPFHLPHFRQPVRDNAPREDREG